VPSEIRSASSNNASGKLYKTVVTDAGIPSVEFAQSVQNTDGTLQINFNPMIDGESVELLA
jgi:hypothetical protein